MILKVWAMHLSNIFSIVANDIGPIDVLIVNDRFSDKWKFYSVQNKLEPKMAAG